MSNYKVRVNGLFAELNMFKFSGGETQVSFKNPSTSNQECAVDIFALITDGDILPLALIVDAVRRTIKDPTITLHMPYLPYARQDRVMNHGEALAIKVFADLLNSLKLYSVIIDDCHSDVGIALIDNVTNNTVLSLPCSHLFTDFDALVAPDAGALKKTFKYAKTLGITEVIRADKTRDVKTGAITGTEIYGIVEGKSVLIIDDICDGGRTFVELGKVLKANGAKRVALYVTHGIFSQGKAALDGIIDETYAKWDWTASA